MRKKMKNLGFTMAELLIVVAIIMVLAGVSFIAVQRTQRSMTQLDRDAVAKEIFIAAQNHLSMAKSEGYRGKTPDSTKATDPCFGAKGTAGADSNYDDVYYITNNDKSLPIYDMMLPLGAIDASVLSNNFIIRYQQSTGTVLDVFYWTADDKTKSYNCSDLNASSYATLVGDGSAADKHANYTGSGLLGWFGGEGAVQSGKNILNAPGIQVFNEEQLYVTVTDTNTGTDVEGKALKLIVTGLSSEAKVAIPLSATSSQIANSGNTYKVVLDDITSTGMHFAQLNDFSSNGFQYKKDANGAYIPFIPGENIAIQAVAYSNDELTNVAYSGEWTTNSLFGEISQNTLAELYAEMTEDANNMRTPKPDDSWITAKIGCIRHLENLNAVISGLDQNDTNDKLNITNAIQVSDLDWKGKKGEKGEKDENGFLFYFGGTATVTSADGTKAAKENCFVPVTPSHVAANGSTISTVPMNYNGMGIVATTNGTTTEYSAMNHTVKNIEVDNTAGNLTIENGGLFGSVTGASKDDDKRCRIENLELIDCNIRLTSGNVGALAGKLTNCTVSNVLARNTTEFEATLTESAPTVYTKSGSAGGLVGIETDTVIQKCAAALIVESDAGNAGGLVGSMTNGSITDSFSGGHTIDKKDDDENIIGVDYDDAAFNVTGSAAVGGLVGDADKADISNSYSTCSATGATVGGLIGTGGSAITNCYATGRVAGTTMEGAFAGSLSSNPTGCKYFEIINERPDDADYPYLPARGNLPTDTSIQAIDADAQSYNDFVGARKDSEGKNLWASVGVVYDDTLGKYYNDGKDADGNTITLFPLRTVPQLPDGELKSDARNLKTGTADMTDYFVSKHYGDWPAPEIFIINEATN